MNVRREKCFFLKNVLWLSLQGRKTSDCTAMQKPTSNTVQSLTSGGLTQTIGRGCWWYFQGHYRHSYIEMKDLSSLELPSMCNRLSEIHPSAITAEKTEEAICRLKANKSACGDGFPSAVHKPSGRSGGLSCHHPLPYAAWETADSHHYGARTHLDHTIRSARFLSLTTWCVHFILRSSSIESACWCLSGQREIQLKGKSG